MELRNGMRVMCKMDYERRKVGGLYGTIVDYIDNESYNVGVKFDTFVSGHSCDGNCEKGYGWYVPRSHLVPAFPSLR